MTTAALRKVLLHACPRCSGDLFLDREDELYTCLQCGRVVTLSRMSAVALHDPLLVRAMAPEKPRLKLVPREVSHDDAA